MNALKMSTTVPFVIVLFVCGVYRPGVIFVHGVYGPGFNRLGIDHPEEIYGVEEDLPAVYTLESFTSDSPNLKLLPSSTYEFEYNEEIPANCILYELSSSVKSLCVFQRANVEFISMVEEEITLMVHGTPSTEWKANCCFSTALEAQQFYKLITQDRPAELEFIAKVDSMENWDVVTEELKLYRKSAPNSTNITIVVKDNDDDAVLLFQKNTVSGITQPEPTSIEFVITSPQGLRRTPYKFVFSTPSEASSLTELLN